MQILTTNQYLLIGFEKVLSLLSNDINLDEYAIIEYADGKLFFFPKILTKTDLPPGLDTRLS